MSRIVIDARMLGWPGIGRYSRNLLSELGKIDKSNQYHVLLRAADYEGWQTPGANFHKVLAEIEPYWFGEQLQLLRLLWQLKPDLVHFTSTNSPLLYWGKKVTTIHDTTLLHFKNLRPGKRLLYELKYWAFRLLMWVAAKTSRAIIVPSRYVKDDLLRRFRLNPLKISITYESSDQLKAVAEPVRGVKQPFLLYVGSIYPHKNLSRLVEAFGQLATSHPKLQLVIAGQGNDEVFRAQLQQQAEAAGLSKQVIFTGRVSDGQLVWLYQSCELLVFPSLSEGFGLPALEAMGHGAAVAAANASCLPEICGEAAEYFDPKDPADIAATITNLLADDKHRGELIKRGWEQVKHYSWSKMAEQTLAVYKSI